MYQTGALIVESSKLLLPALTAAARVVSKVLYIPLDYDTPPHTPDRRLCLASQQIKQIYFEVSKSSPLLDIRIVLPPPSNYSPSNTAESSIPSLQFDSLDVVLSSLPSLEKVRQSGGYRLLTQRVEVDLEQRFKQLEVQVGYQSALSLCCVYYTVLV